MEARQHKPRIQLPPDLIGQRMAEHQGLVALALGRNRLGRQIRHIGIRQTPGGPHESLLAQCRITVLHEDHRIPEAGQKTPARRQHPRAFTPHGPHIGHVEVGDGVKDHIKAGVCKDPQIAHIALHAGQRKAFALGHMPVLRKLAG